MDQGGSSSLARLITITISLSEGVCIPKIDPSVNLCVYEVIG